MSILEWLLWIGVVIFVVLTVILVAALVRLNRELQQLGEDTGLAAKRLRQTLRTIHIVAPAVALIKGTAERTGRRVGRLRKKGIDHGNKKV